ncbi:MAG: ABC transporter substrate-binding protein [Clostridia bacterium]|nr:ABC transporter substrate-binding protein [Clostridia bacterium]
MKRFVKMISLSLALLLILSTAAAMADAANNTFIYGIAGDPGNDINTVSTSSRYDLTTERVLYSPLYNYYGPDDIEFRLAESFELSEDGKELTAHLRQGVVWSDGEPFTADDVVFTYEFIINTDYANGHDTFVYGDEKVTVEKIDDYTVKFTAPIYTPTLVSDLAAEHYIMPKHIYEGDETLDNNPKNATPVGTGPYILEEYKPGEFLRFKANEQYFLGAPKIKTLIFQIVTDNNTASLAVKTGEINALFTSTTEAADFAGSDVSIYAYPEGRVSYTVFNLSSSRTQDINLRKAVFYALNREEINLGTYGSEDYFLNAYTFLPVGNAFVTDDVEHYDQNLELAKEYLAKVEGEIPTLRIGYTANNVAQETTALIMQQELKAAGITLELIAFEGSAMTNLLYAENDDADLYLTGYIMGDDPSSYGTLFVSTGSANFSHVKDEELDGYFAAGSVEQDPDRRKEIYDSAQRRLADLAVQFPFATDQRLLVLTNDIGGVEEARLIPIYFFSNLDRLYFK